MPRQQRPAGSAFTRRALPFAPLAIAVLLQNATLPSDEAGGRVATMVSEVSVATCDDVETMEACHTAYPTGCSNSDNPRYDAYLNLMKNQLVSRDATPQAVFTRLSDFQALDVKLPEGLKKGNHETFRKELAAIGEGQVFGVVGFLYYVSKAGGESVNCNLTAAEAVDLHIGVGFDASVAAQLRELRKARKGVPQELKSRLMRESVVVEMTPHFRATVGDAWSYEGVRAQTGKAVFISGQLMADNEHNVKSQNCALPGADKSKCWRGTAWELHPVSRFKVCGNEAGCTPEAGPWTDLESLED